MIQIQLTSALALYSGIIILGTLAIWLYTELATYRRRNTLEKQNLWRCAFCRYIYLDEMATTVSECPRCHSLNAVDDKLARYIKSEKPVPEKVPIEEGEESRRNPSRRRRRGGRRGGRRRR